MIDATAQWEKMRKSIGSKRRYLSEANMQTITHLYGQFEDADPGLSKVLRTEEFGYRTITVEQPLRQVFSVDQDRIEKALSLTPIKKMDKVLRERLRAALESMNHETVWTSRRDFDKELGAALVAQEMGLKPAQRAAVMRAFAKSSPEGELVTNLKGGPEPDPSLRDTENVPLTEDIDTYVAREVLPWAPEAWVNHTRTKVGYEIPFTRVFYKYVPPRPLAEIDADVQAAIARVQALFAEVKA